LHRSEQIPSLFTYQKAQTLKRRSFFPYGQENKEFIKKSTIRILPANQESSHPKIFNVYLGTSNSIAA